MTKCQDTGTYTLELGIIMRGGICSVCGRWCVGGRSRGPFMEVANRRT